MRWGASSWMTLPLRATSTSAPVLRPAREIILAADERVTESIKWKTPTLRQHRELQPSKNLVMTADRVTAANRSRAAVARWLSASRAGGR
jgi:hypothetical protein